MSLVVTTKESEKQPVLRIRITFDADPYPTFHSDADPVRDSSFQCDANPDSRLIPSNASKWPSNDSTFSLWCGSDPAFHFDVDPDPDFLFDADPDPASLNDADLDGSGSARLKTTTKRRNYTNQSTNWPQRLLSDTLTKNWKTIFGE